MDGGRPSTGSRLLAAEPTAGNAAGKGKPQPGLAYELFGGPTLDRLGASGSVPDITPMDKGHNDWSLRFTGLLMPPVDGDYALRAEERGGGAAARPRAGAMPAGWLADWKTPPVRHRPLQIIHVIEPGKGLAQIRHGTGGARHGHDDARLVLVRGRTKRRSRRGRLQRRRSADISSPKTTGKTLETGVRSCAELGMVVWLYDEDGYPSGAAGGLVLAREPGLRGHGLGPRPDAGRPVCRPPVV